MPARGGQPDLEEMPPLHREVGHWQWAKVQGSWGSQGQMQATSLKMAPSALVRSRAHSRIGPGLLWVSRGQGQP